ncbi:MAG: hypothetical protein LBD77_03000 [Bifidobacteriaceae bacterium]|nr:hypothetical protein [Bifidobacteriaceae bacterium]
MTVARTGALDDAADSVGDGWLGEGVAGREGVAAGGEEGLGLGGGVPTRKPERSTASAAGELGDGAEPAPWFGPGVHR